MERVIFNEDEHSYTAENSKKKYTSVTTLISKFKQPFDKVAISTAYAKKNGGTPKQWQDKWKKISDDACKKGTEFHTKKENEILLSVGKEARPLTADQSFKHTTSLDFSNIKDGTYTEVVLHNHYFEIAGQVDRVDFDEEFFDIDDHKTNKRIDRFSFYNPKTGKYKFMKAPLEHIMDSNYWHYVLQISEYAFMIEQLTGKKARNLKFTHYPPDVFGKDGISSEGLEYKVPYLKDEVLKMLGAFSGKDISQFK